VGTFEHTHIHTCNSQVMSHGSGRYRSTCYLLSCNSFCTSGDLQLQAPLSIGANDDDNIELSSLGLGRARAFHHCCPLAPAFHPASSCSQQQGQVLGPSSSSSLFPLLSPCPRSCCPVLIPSSLICPILAITGVIPRVVWPIVLLSVVLFHLLLAFHGSFPLNVLIHPIAPCFHPASSCLQQWLGVLPWWWLLLWLAGCHLIVISL
jgi:hypothetical protein